MADKGLNLFGECASQMGLSEVRKTSAIAKVIILVEQAIRRIKTFKLLPTTILSEYVLQYATMRYLCTMTKIQFI